MARVRPRVEFRTHLSAEQVVAQVGKRLKSNACPVSGLSAPERIELHVHGREVHLWSPQLVIDLEDEGTECHLHGRFGPHPSVWTMYMAGYATCAFLCLLGLSFGYAQWTMGGWPWALFGIPCALAGAMILYALAFWGQQRGKDQMHQLENFLREEISLHESLAPSRENAQRLSPPAN